MAAASPPGWSYRPMLPANSTSPVSSVAGRRRRLRRPAGPAGRTARTPRCVPARAGLRCRAPRSQPLTVRQRHHIVRLSPAGDPAELLLEHGQERRVEVGQRVHQPVPVVGVDEGRDPVRAAHRCDRVGVVEVAVGQQHGCRAQPVLFERVRELVQDLDTGVDDDALLPSGRCDDVAVRPEDGRREASQQHRRRLSSGRVQFVTWPFCAPATLLPRLARLP